MTTPDPQLTRLQTLRAAGELSDAQYESAVALLRKGKLGPIVSPQAAAGPKLFTQLMVILSTNLGGLGAAGTLIGVNLFRLGRKREALIWAVGGFLVPLVTITIANASPALERIPNPLWNVTWMLMVGIAYRTLLAEDLQGQPTVADQRETWWRALLLALGCGILLLALLYVSISLFGGG